MCSINIGYPNLGPNFGPMFKNNDCLTNIGPLLNQYRKTILQYSANVPTLDQCSAKVSLLLGQFFDFATHSFFLKLCATHKISQILYLLKFFEVFFYFELFREILEQIEVYDLLEYRPIGDTPNEPNHVYIK